MATYGAQPQSAAQATGRSNSSSGINQNNTGLLADLFSSQPSPKNLKIPQKDLLVFFRQLAVILQSGVPLAQGLLLIADNMTNQRFAGCVQHIAARLSAGEELSLSLKIYPKVFEPLAVGLIEELRSQSNCSGSPTHKRGVHPRCPEPDKNRMTVQCVSGSRRLPE